MLAMRHSDGDKMKKVFIGAVLAVAITGAANAQGTWYTDYATWASKITSGITTADYNSTPTGLFGSPYTESGVTATATGGFFDLGIGALTTNSNTASVSFTFGNNSFGGFFANTDNPGNPVADTLTFSVDGSNINTQVITTLTSGFSFVGYVSDSVTPITLGISTLNYVTVDSFSFGAGSNNQNPGGGNGGAVPEPGTVVSMGLLGAGVLGLVVRSRRRISN